jgi:hypothetical protein
MDWSTTFRSGSLQWRKSELSEPGEWGGGGSG